MSGPTRGEDTEREDRGGRGGRGGKGKEAKHKARPPATKEYIERESTRLKTSLDAYLDAGRGGAGGKSGAAKMVATRANLPASASREEVTAAVQGVPVVVLSGETGQGGY